MSFDVAENGLQSRFGVENCSEVDRAFAAGLFHYRWNVIIWATRKKMFDRFGKITGITLAGIVEAHLV